MTSDEIPFVDLALFANIDKQAISIGIRVQIKDLRSAIALMASTLATGKVAIEPDHSTRLEGDLTPLDKNPGVKPIRIGATTDH